MAQSNDIAPAKGQHVVASSTLFINCWSAHIISSSDTPPKSVLYSQQPHTVWAWHCKTRVTVSCIDHGVSILRLSKMVALNVFQNQIKEKQYYLENSPQCSLLLFTLLFSLESSILTWVLVLLFHWLLTWSSGWYHVKSSSSPPPS